LACLLALPFITSCTVITEGVDATGSSIIRFFGGEPEGTVVLSDNGLGESIAHANLEEEYYLGRAVAATILSRYQEFSDAELDSYLNQLGLSLALRSDLPQTFAGYRFVVLRSSELNAFAAPGGFVFITTGLLRILPDEEALAAIIAHEITHVARAHGILALARKETQGKFQKALSALAVSASSIQCPDVLSQAEAVFAIAVSELVDVLLVSGYSKEQEFEADAGAIRLLQARGYNVKGLHESLQALAKREKSAHGGWFATHPSPAERIEQLLNSQHAESSSSLSVHAYAKRKRRFLRMIKRVPA
jgi:predicted Zn-dependent protease